MVVNRYSLFELFLRRIPGLNYWIRGLIFGRNWFELFVRRIFGLNYWIRGLIFGHIIFSTDSWSEFLVRGLSLS